MASGSGWNLWVWLLGVVVRRYIDFFILLISTPLVSVLFYSSIPTFFSFLKCFSFLCQYFFVMKIFYIPPTLRNCHPYLMLIIEIYVYIRGMQPYLITYSHRYISSSMHGKLSKTSEATVKCIYYCLFKLQKDDSKDLHCIAHGKWVCKKNTSLAEAVTKYFLTSR